MGWRRYALCVVFPLVGFAQTQGNTGQIGGLVYDPSGALIRAAHVQIISIETGSMREVLTGEEGQYRAVLIPPGAYRIRVEASGFAPATAEGVLVTVGAGVDQDFHLTLGTVTDAVTVTTPFVEVSRSEFGNGIARTT